METSEREVILKSDHAAELLIDALRVTLGDEAAATRLSGNSDDWQRMGEYALATGLAPLLYRRLLAVKQHTAVPVAVLQRWHQAYFSNLKRNQVLLHELTTVVAALHAHDIPVILLKGAYFAHYIYEDAAMRTMGDCDLLIPRQHFETAKALMDALGYQPYNEDAAAHPYHLAYVHRERPARMEIHWQLTDVLPQDKETEQTIWNAAGLAMLGETSIQTLTPEILVIYLCLHFTTHFFMGLDHPTGVRSLYDIAEIIRQLGQQLDWAMVASLCCKWQVERKVYLTLLLLNQLLQPLAPKQVLRVLCPDEESETILSLLLDHLFLFRSAPEEKMPSKTVLQLSSPGNFVAKGCLFFQHLFLPRKVLAKEYGLSNNSPWLCFYYLVRIKDLYCRHKCSTQALLTGDPEVLAFAQHLAKTKKLELWATNSIYARLPSH